MESLKTGYRLPGSTFRLMRHEVPTADGVREGGNLPDFSVRYRKAILIACGAMLDSLLQTGIVQNLLKYLSWAFITGIFFSGALVVLGNRLKKNLLKKVAYIFSFSGPLVLFLMILGGSVIIAGTEELSSLKLSIINQDALQNHPQISQALEVIYVLGCWILLVGSFCSGLLMIIKNKLPKYKVFNISYLFSFVGPILFIFCVSNKTLEIDDWEIYGLKASWYQKAAENGDPWAQVELGQCYLEGRGVNKNEEEAFSLFKKAADRGYADGQYYLGWCCEKGIGVTQDYAKAVLWYQKAAQQGDEESQARLGWFYSGGKGFPKNDKEAVKWLTKSAEQGNAWAQMYLGWLYLYGKGVPKDERGAVRWLMKSAEQGYQDSQNGLAWCYRNGKGTRQNDAEAVKWYRKSAKKGDSYGQNGVAWILSTSQDESIRDGKEALKWALIALKTAGENDANALDTLAAAYAEQGDFSAAITTQEKAIRNLKKKTQTDEFYNHLHSYNEKKPWREYPKDRGL